MVFKPVRANGRGNRVAGVRVSSAGTAGHLLIIGSDVIEQAGLTEVDHVIIAVGEGTDSGHLLVEPAKNGGQGYRLLRQTINSSTKRLACIAPLRRMGVADVGDVPWKAKKGRLVIDLRPTIKE